MFSLYFTQKLLSRAYKKIIKYVIFFAKYLLSVKYDIRTTFAPKKLILIE